LATERAQRDRAGGPCHDAREVDDPDSLEWLHGRIVCTSPGMLCLRHAEDGQLKYESVEAARRMPGLRLVLTRDVPGPWGEAAKYFFAVKKLAYTPVEQ